MGLSPSVPRTWCTQSHWLIDWYAYYTYACSCSDYSCVLQKQHMHTTSTQKTTGYGSSFEVGFSLGELPRIHTLPSNGSQTESGVEQLGRGKRATGCVLVHTCLYRDSLCMDVMVRQSWPRNSVPRFGLHSFLRTSCRHRYLVVPERWVDTRVPC